MDIVNGYDPTATDAEGLIWLPLTVTDPGRDGVLGTGDDRTLTVYGLRADRPAPVYKATNPPEAERKYWAMILTFDKRLADRWQLSGSVVYSSFRGNVGAGNDATLGMTSMFNTPNSLTNAYGPLAFDRPLQVQLMASWILPFDFVIGAHYHYSSGAPYSRTLQVYFPADYMGYGTRSAYYTVMAEAAAGRYPATSILDLRLEKAFSVGKGKKFSLSLDAFNVLGDNGVLSDLDPTWIVRADLAVATYAAGPTYGRVLSVYGVRSFRLGLKYSF